MIEDILNFERDAFLWLNGSDSFFLDKFMWLFTGKIVWIPLIILFLYVILYKKNWKESLLIVLSIVVLITICDQFASGLCKPLFTRFRPTHHPDFKIYVDTVFNYRGGRYGFISSHAINAFGFAMFSALLFRFRWYSISIFSWAILMAYTRIYLGVHFITDIIPAILFGCLFGFLVYCGYLFVRTKLLSGKGEGTIREIRPNLLFSKSQKTSLVLGLHITTFFLMSFNTWLIKII